MPINNGTLTAATVATMLPNFHSWPGFVFNSPDAAVWINFGNQDAAPNVGRYFEAGQDAIYSGRTFPEMNARVTVYPLTGGNYSLTPNY